MRKRAWLRFCLGLAPTLLLIAGCQPVPTQTPTPALSAPTLVVDRAASPSPTPWLTGQPTPESTDTPWPPPTETPTQLPPTKTPIPFETPTPLPPTSTDTPTPPPPTEPPASTDTPAPTATPRPPTLTSTPTSTYRFLPVLPAWADPSHPCPGCPKAPAYIVGYVTDAAGNPLAGVRLVCYNDWHRYDVVASKGGGEYDFPIVQADTTWYVMVLDQSDQPISPAAPVTVTLTESCRYILNWQRVD